MAARVLDDRVRSGAGVFSLQPRLKAAKTINELAPIDPKKLRPLSTMQETNNDQSRYTDLLTDQNQTDPDVAQRDFEQIMQRYQRSYSTQGFLSARQINSNQVVPPKTKTTEAGWAAKTLAKSRSQQQLREKNSFGRIKFENGDASELINETA